MWEWICNHPYLTTGAVIVILAYVFMFCLFRVKGKADDEADAEAERRTNDTQPPDTPEE